MVEAITVAVLACGLAICAFQLVTSAKAVE